MKQEIFDKVARHLLTQGERSMSLKGGQPALPCLYRGVGGLKCAVGVLIKDEYFSAAWNGDDIEKPDVRVAVQLSLGAELDESDWGLLHTLQGVHDNHRVYEWEEALRQVAKQYRLDPKVLDQ